MLLLVSLGLLWQTPLVETASPAVEQIEGAIRVTGLGFQADFDATGAIFRPALGETAPRTETLQFLGTLRLERDGSSQRIEPKTAWEVEHEHLSRLLAEGIEERFDLFGDRVEHSFVLNHRPVGRGPLRLAIPLGGSLAASGVTPDGRSVNFLTNQGGGFRVEGLVGVDAAGRREAGWLESVDEQLVYCLPGEFVDSAVLPLVVDPWIVPQLTIVPSGSELQGPAVVRHGASDRLLFAWVQVYSSSAADLLALRTTGNGVPLGALIPVETSPAESTGYPDITVWSEQSTWLLLYRRNWTSQDPFSRLRGVCITTDGTVGPTTELSTAPASFPLSKQAVGPVDSTGRLFYCTTRGTADLTYQHFGHRADIGVDGSGLPLATPVFEGFLLSSFHGNLSLCRFPVSGNRRLVAMTEALGGIPEDGTRVGVRLSNQVGSGASIHWLELPGSFLTNMYLSGQGDEFVLTYKRYSISVIAPSALIGLFARPIRIEGSNLIFGAEVALPTFATGDYVSIRGLNYSGESYQVLLYGASSLPQGGSQELLSVMELDAASLAARTNSPFSFVSPLSSSGPANAGTVGYLGQSETAPDTWMVAWTKGVVGLVSPLNASVYRSPGQVEGLGGGCGQGGQTRASHAATGTYQFSPGISGAAPFSPALLAIALDASPLACGSCVLYPDLAALFFFGAGATDALGRASWTQPIPINPALIGFQFHAQGAVIPPGPACFPLSIDLSSAVRVTIE
jgi:hypothetical protein